MDLLINHPWFLHSFPSVWKSSSIIPIHKVGPASSLTTCVLKLFEHIFLSHLLFFLEFHSILSPNQAGFRPGRVLIKFVVFLCPFSMGLANPSRLSENLCHYPLFETFDFVWHSFLLHKLISTGLSSYVVRWTHSFLSDRCACVVFQNQKSRSFFESTEMFRKDPLFALYFSFV